MWMMTMQLDCETRVPFLFQLLLVGIRSLTVVWAA